jgi:prepilin-type N-terminal cleavage/methylation domain-containing protein
MRVPPGRRDAGFSLVELIVVMLVIGILAAIAIPVILDQRQKANDAATRSDANQVGKRVVEHWLDGTTPPTVVITAGRYVVAGDDLGEVSPNVVVAGTNPAVVDTTGWTASTWCLALTNPDGSLAGVRFSAQQGLQSGTCSSPTVP